MQARMTQNDPRLYNVNRDVAHNFDGVIQEVARSIETNRYKPLGVLAKADGVTDEELGRACQALCLFMGVQADEPKESMAQCLERCGFLAVHPTARVIVMAYLGNVTLGYHWAGVREATMSKAGPALTYKQLRWFGKAMTLAMSMPPWKRRLYRWHRRIRRAWRAYNERTLYDG